MKNLLAIFVFLYLLYPETSKSNFDEKVMISAFIKGKRSHFYHANSLFATNFFDANLRSGCLDTYLSFVTALDNQNNMALQNCRQTFVHDVDGWIECNQFSMDVYLLMHAVADAAYDRCVN